MIRTDNSAVIASLTRERDEALAEARTLRNAAVDLQAEIERLREHHKVAVDWWMQEAQSVKPLTKEVERLREERDYYRRDNEKLHNALAWEHNESENAMDARRYRWLRTFATWVNEDYESIHYRWNADEFESVDDAIDSAINKEKRND